MTDISTPDPDINRLFAAVGHCLTTWESLESELSHLYSIFIGKPRQIDALQAYGRDSRIFESRMQSLEMAADDFFVRKPDQSIEGEFTSLLARCRVLAKARHQIAHGIVRAVPVYDEPDKDGWVVPSVGFCLWPQWYAFVNLTKHTGKSYMYNSAQIDHLRHRSRRLCEPWPTSIPASTRPPDRRDGERLNQSPKLIRRSPSAAASVSCAC